MAGFRREVFYYKRYYLDFFHKLDMNVQKKFNWTLQLISSLEMIPSKYFKHVESVIGLYEIRVEVEGNIFRAFAFFDKGKIIIIANGFQKKLKRRQNQK
jgi:phage-related protein